MYIIKSCSLEDGEVSFILDKAIVDGDRQGWAKALLRYKAIMNWRYQRGD